MQLFSCASKPEGKLVLRLGLLAADTRARLLAENRLIDMCMATSDSNCVPLDNLTWVRGCRFVATVIVVLLAQLLVLVAAL